MIHINSYKLTPAITATWGDITGNVSNQEDLVEYINEHGTAAWGSISGNISDQSDLMSTLGSYATESWVSSQQFATESWVSDQGYLTSVPSEYATQSWVSEQGYLTSSALTGYATESWVSSQQFATESWVSSQGYLTSETLPSDIATQSWVESQGYLSTVPSEYLKNEYGEVQLNTIQTTIFCTNILGDRYGIYLGNYGESGYVGLFTTSWAGASYKKFLTEGDNALTPAQESAIAPLVSKSNGYLKYHYEEYDPEMVTLNGLDYSFFGEYAQIWVYYINGVAYGINFMTPEQVDVDGETEPVDRIYIYKFNEVTNKFEHIYKYGQEEPVYIYGDINIPACSAVTDPHVLWTDSQGRVYFNNTHKVDLTTGEFTAWSMGGTIQTYNGLRSNIFTVNEGIFCLNTTSTTEGTAYKFNEETQLFEEWGPIRGHSFAQVYKNSIVVNGIIYYTYQSGNTAVVKRLYINDEFSSSGKGVNGYTVTGSSGDGKYGDNIKPFPGVMKVGVSNRVIIYSDIRKVIWNGQVVYFYYSSSYDRNYIYVLRPYVSYATSFTKKPISIDTDFALTYNSNGAECGEYLLGFGWNSNYNSYCPLWDFRNLVDEFYGWDNTVDTRLSALEESVGTALEITNNILGV